MPSLQINGLRPDGSPLAAGEFAEMIGGKRPNNTSIPAKPMNLSDASLK
jgi:hypothetical protein